MMKMVMIAIGGGMGAILRYVVSGWAQRLSDGTFPLGTLAVNLIGCAVIGLLGARFAGPHLVREDVRLAILVGLVGAFTTFSTFEAETFALINEGQFGLAMMNILLSNVVGLTAVWGGYHLGEFWFGVS